MLPLILDLFRYQCWADAKLLLAVRAQSGAAEDPQLLGTLHHTVMVQRFFLAKFLDEPFAIDAEQLVPSSFEDLVSAYRRTEAALADFVGSLEDTDLGERRISIQFASEALPTLGEALTQVVLHGQNHRGQCLRRLRELGATPPTIDYIVWSIGRPGPDWGVAREL